MFLQSSQYWGALGLYVSDNVMCNKIITRFLLTIMMVMNVRVAQGGVEVDGGNIQIEKYYSMEMNG